MAKAVIGWVMKLSGGKAFKSMAKAIRKEMMMLFFFIMINPPD